MIPECENEELKLYTMSASSFYNYYKNNSWRRSDLLDFDK